MIGQNLTRVVAGRNIAIPPEHIGGATVRRPFTLGAGEARRTLRAGDELTREEVLAIPVRNRNALVAIGSMAAWPMHPQAGEPDGAHQPQRFAVHRGQGRYDVIEGYLLNPEPLTKADADKLAAEPPVVPGASEETPPPN